jgi:hypothetical protein
MHTVCADALLRNLAETAGDSLKMLSQMVADQPATISRKRQNQISGSQHVAKHSLTADFH